MGLERGAFQFGVASFPLVESTVNDLLQDADPALFHTLALLESTFNTYFGKRLLAQAALHDYALPSAVVNTAGVDPAPYLYADQFRFPLLCLYRKKDVWDEHTIVYDKSTSTWEFAYILPPLSPKQIKDIQPILRSASVTIRRVIHMGHDPAFRDDENVWATAGIQKARLVDVTYGGFPRIDKLDEFYRAITGTISVLEREQPVLSAFDNFDGADVGIDLLDNDKAAIADFVDIATHQPPTLTSISPPSGSASGGDLVTLTGTGFRLGTRPVVLFDDARADAVTVVSATSVTCRTPPHGAYPSVVVDVTLLAADGQSAALPAAFMFNAP